MKKLKNYSCIDLFSGAGGLSLAARNLGHNILAAVELNTNACKTYELNFIKKNDGKIPKLYEENILNLDPANMRKELGLKSGQLDILMGGPPCQGFSTHRTKNSGVNDPRNELLIRYFDFINEFKPKAFIVENVTGLLLPRHENYLKKFLSLAENSDYNVFAPQILDARDFGIPQRRKRIFIVGYKKGISLTRKSWPPKATHFAPGKGNPVWQTASSVFEKPSASIINKIKSAIIDKVESFESLKFGDPLASKGKDENAIGMNHTQEIIDVFASTPINGSRMDSNRVLDCHKDHKGHRDVYGRIKLYEPGPTMTAGCNNPSKGRFVHPWENRGITLRHAARFQSFPDDFIFLGGPTSASTQIGNAVPPKLGEVVLNSVALSLAIN